MGQAQRQEQQYEALYGNREPGTNKANGGRTEVLYLDDLLGDAIAFELRDPQDLQLS